jgi:hypothetical protein
MFYPHEYANRDIDAQIMLNHLESSRGFTTAQAQDAFDRLQEDLQSEIKLYKDTRQTEKYLGYWRLVLASRNIHTDPCDDCTHWF